MVEASSGVGLDVHDALDLGGVEVVHDGLPAGDLELRLSVGEGGGDGGGVGEAPVLAEAVEGTALGVLSDVVVAELPRRPDKGTEEREDLRPCWCAQRRHF
ncbi:hypothetical protein TIFTF001_023375 [Ficus carica]|uniref:Uncharacterized protein n=1 Tax=Ficus carica TaxID=3494 RepID=A0AA88ALN4_FICCA|nr:hypothetical protein TIFTF001_023375 [Ficus carica]